MSVHHRVMMLLMSLSSLLSLILLAAAASLSSAYVITNPPSSAAPSTAAASSVHAAISQSKVVNDRDYIGNESLIPYQLYTRKNVYDRQTILLGDVQSLLQSHFNASWPVKFYGGGWPGGDGAAFRIRYLERGDYNFIQSDWQFVAPVEDLVISGIRLAGQHGGAFIDFLMENTGVPLSAFHVFGHSAGAHVAGAIGLGFRERHNFNQILPRVTGLDPANFIPDMSVIDDRIDPTDAQQVDIIHTDDVMGILQPLGTIDFFVNGGANQPGCPEGEGCCCNHGRAYDLFEESIYTEIGFVSYRCDSYESYKNGNCFGNDRQSMGEFITSNATGFYYLETNAERPYARG